MKATPTSVVSWITTLPSSLTATAVVGLTALTRWLAAPFQRGSSEYQTDGLLDTCVKPWQLFTGQAVAGGDNCYLSFAVSYLASSLFGYRVEILQGVQIATAALAYGIIFLALERMLGRGSALRTSILLIVLLPFISHGVLPTNMHTALWGYSGALFALTMQPSLRRDLVLALSCTVALLGYAAGVVALVPIVLGHVLFWRSSWPLRRVATFAGLSSGVVVAVAAVRRILSGTVDPLHWAVDRLSLPPLADYLSTVKVILRDLFVSADSWYALGYGQPYISAPVALFLVCAVTCAVLWLSVSRRPDFAESALRSARARWIVLFLVSSLVAILIASINTRVPGIRRAFPAVIPMLAAAATAPALVPRGALLPVLLNVLFAATVAWEGARSVEAIRGRWDPAPPFSWTLVSNFIADRLPGFEEAHIVVVDRALEPSFDRVFCGLYMDEDTRLKAAMMLGYDLSGATDLQLWRDGVLASPVPIFELPAAPLLVVSVTTERAERVGLALERAGRPSVGSTVNLVIQP
jgi:hypothetical protein